MVTTIIERPGVGVEQCNLLTTLLFTNHVIYLVSPYSKIRAYREKEIRSGII